LSLNLGARTTVIIPTSSNRIMADYWRLSLAVITDTRMSAIGPKQTYGVALHMSAFRGKADMTIGACPLSRSLSRVKRT
jgi:hypothetical protein